MYKSCIVAHERFRIEMQKYELTAKNSYFHDFQKMGI